MKVVKYVGALTVILLILLSLTFAYQGGTLQRSYPERNRIMLQEKDRLMVQRRVKISQELQDLLRERDRITAEMQLLLREEEVNTENLQGKLKALKEVEEKIFLQKKNNLMNALEKSLSLTKEQKEKVQVILENNLEQIRNLRNNLREKNLEMRALKVEESDKADQLKDEIKGIRNEIRKVQKNMWKEIREMLDRDQIKKLDSILSGYNRYGFKIIIPGRMKLWIKR
ncbi:MAG TPA: hypothetical protein PKW23_00025 [Dictyoglomaceae bacterium]|nr:hypothetical protein [Dictyoglomaceae bacterium]HOL39450.1 hypothetical protein [Dictyoglomaceae bacterium]HPP15409.1 hypothetical protein [Dictyoglomaceae bacterium]HPU43844.1 hypothetical protein [Dictyoglomaceae bacterium]